MWTPRRLDSVIERTDGVTASFLKELLRRAALCRRAVAGAGLVVSADQLDEALDELLDTRNAMTRVLLGGRDLEVPIVVGDAGDEAPDDDWPDHDEPAERAG